MAKNLMLCGTMSDVGKSFLVAGLCRLFKQDGYRVAPFKSQNMALNSFVTSDGCEIGRAQAMQAEAAGIPCDARMNPILLKPTGNHASQVILNGKAYGVMAAADYYREKKRFMPDVLHAYEGLRKENDLVVIEGAGSPAEINLRENDIVNMGLAEAVDAPVLLVGDIDRGGVFAQLYGTLALLSEEERARVKGLVINKFRGDVGLLEPGLREIEKMTGKQVLGVIPFMDVELDDEDSLSGNLLVRTHDKPIDIAVIRLPRISNFTDYTPLSRHPLLGVRFVKNCEQLGSPDCIILPGTKNTMDDLAALKENGLFDAILQRHGKGTLVIGICGGFQMLGERLHNMLHTEGTLEEQAGFGLLPLETYFVKEKVLRRRKACIGMGVLAGARVEGYEVHAAYTVKVGCAMDREGAVKVSRAVDREEAVKVGSTVDREEAVKVSRAVEVGETANISMVAGADKTVGAADALTEYAADGVTKYTGADALTEYAGVDGLTEYAGADVYGSYLHGIFDTGEAVDALARYLVEKKGMSKEYRLLAAETHVDDARSQKEAAYDRLADGLRRALDMEKIYGIMF